MSRLPIVLAALALIGAAGPPATDLTRRPDASVSGLIPFGGTTAKDIQLSRREGPGRTLAGTRAIVRTTPGSGAFGPASADYALLLGAIKDGWQASPTEGEVDGLYVVARQGKRGDVGGLLADVAKRRDRLGGGAAGENGGAGGAEFATQLVDAGGRVYHNLHAVMAFAEGPGGVSGGRGYGYWAHPEQGLWYAAYAAEESRAGSFLNYLTGARGPNAAAVNFRIDRNGTIFQGFPARQTRTGFDAASDRWRITDEGGVAMLEVDRRAKTLSAPGGVRMGGGSTLAWLGAGRFRSALPALPPGRMGPVWRQRVAGAAPGDMVTVAATGPGEAALSIALTGMVTGPGMVAVRARNGDGAALPAGALFYAIKVERFAG